MSSDYLYDRAYVGPSSRITSGLHFDRTPYEGNTVLTGTNSAVIEFHYDDDHVTYGTIQVDDGEVVEYDSIYDMINNGGLPI